mmetsp:Transcript_10161/g.13024  ORF Transcript_10161/g.13024 Transcript_10161/m.13024 type:complete len:83 (-) Transcript_10161:88-336(-)
MSRTIPTRLPHVDWQALKILWTKRRMENRRSNQGEEESLEDYEEGSKWIVIRLSYQDDDVKTLPSLFSSLFSPSIIDGWEKM